MTHGQNEEPIFIKYRYIFDDGLAQEFSVELDPVTLELSADRNWPRPDWARLEFCQCPNCPLNPADEPYCPVALCITDLIEFFKDSVSYHEVRVVVETPERNYSRRVSLQQGISALLGIMMVASGCPVMAKLRPMVRFHLPFATPEETTYRAASMYLVAQYLKAVKGKNPDWEMKGLVDIYDQVQQVNISFARRLQGIRIQDASLNAVVILDNFGNFIKLSIDCEMLSEMDSYFHPLIDD